MCNSATFQHPSRVVSLVLASLGSVVPLSTASASEPADAVDHRVLPFLMATDFEDMDQVAWRVEQGRADSNNPLLEPEMPWDIGGVFAHGTVLRDPIDGLWKAWHISTPLAPPLAQGTFKHLRRLTYLESKDGISWKRPQLSFVSWEGHERTNILMEVWASYASVNIDSARSWPYEMFVFLDPTYGIGSGMIAGLPLPPGMTKHPYGLYRFRSKDGKAWEVIEGPINLNTADSCYIYRNADGKYVAYHKTERPAFPGGVIPWDIGDGLVRLIGRRTSDDGSTWSNPTELVLTPDWRDSADTQFMELCPLAVPGGYIATVTVYHNFSQRVDLQWAASRDGVTWWRPNREPALPNPPLGEPSGGMIWPMQTLIADNQKLYVYYGGCESLHGDLYNTKFSLPRYLKASGDILSRLSSSLPDYSSLCRAEWTADRLWALVPVLGGPYEGTATTRSQPLTGKKLLVNVVTRPQGELRIELLDNGGHVIPGFSRNDCQPIQGDHHATYLNWTGGTEAPESASKIRFVLKRAFVYGFDTEKAND